MLRAQGETQAPSPCPAHEPCLHGRRLRLFGSPDKHAPKDVERNLLGEAPPWALGALEGLLRGLGGSVHGEAQGRGPHGQHVGPEASKDDGGGGAPVGEALAQHCHNLRGVRGLQPLLELRELPFHDLGGQDGAVDVPVGASIGPIRSLWSPHVESVGNHPAASVSCLLRSLLGLPADEPGRLPEASLFLPA